MKKIEKLGFENEKKMVYFQHEFHYFHAFSEFLDFCFHLFLLFFLVAALLMSGEFAKIGRIENILIK